MPRYIPADIDPGNQGGGGGNSALNPKTKINFIVTGTMTKNALEAVSGVKVNMLAGNIASVRSNIENVKLILAVTGVTGLSLAPPVAFAMDEAAQMTWAPTIWGSPYPGMQTGYTGKGVIVGIIDTGLDIIHQDFRKLLAADNFSAGGPSRVLEGWDMTITPGTDAIPPTGFSYGIRVTPTHIVSMIAAGIQSALVDGVYRPMLRDDLGHGTNVAGVSVGNGTSPNGLANIPPTPYPCRYVGLAPEADIVVVKLPSFPNTADVINAVQYLFNVATTASKAAVACLSVTSREGQHDGFSNLDKALEAIVAVEEGAGRWGRHLIASAGNEGNTKRHYAFTFPSTPAGPHGFSLYPSGLASPNYPAGSAMDSILMQGWVDATTQSTVSVTTTYAQYGGAQSANTAVTATHGNEVTGTYNGTTVRIRNCVDAAINGKKKIEIQVTNDGVTQTHLYTAMTMAVSRTGGVSTAGTYDFYMVSSQISGLSPDKAIFVGTNIGYNSGITSPGSCLAALCVGGLLSNGTYVDSDGLTENFGYVWGGLYSYGSKGPLLGTATIKPDLAAPCDGLVTSFSKTKIPQPYSYEKDLDRTHSIVDNWNAQMGGTSIAAAITAGAVALYCQKYGKQTTANMIYNFTILFVSGYTWPGGAGDTYHPTLPNNDIGYGKLWLQVFGGNTGVDLSPIIPEPLGGTTGGPYGENPDDPPIVRDNMPTDTRSWIDASGVVRLASRYPQVRQHVFNEPYSPTAYDNEDPISLTISSASGVVVYKNNGTYTEQDQVWRWNGFLPNGLRAAKGVYSCLVNCAARSYTQYIYLYS